MNKKLNVCIFCRRMAALFLLGGIITATAEGASVENGKVIWTKTCRLCHESPRMLAKLGVKNPDDIKPEKLGKLDPAKFAEAVHKGKGKMKPLSKLTDADVEDTRAYLATLASNSK